MSRIRTRRGVVKVPSTSKRRMRSCRRVSSEEIISRAASIQESLLVRREIVKEERKAFEENKDPLFLSFGVSKESQK